MSQNSMTETKTFSLANQNVFCQLVATKQTEIIFLIVLQVTVVTCK